MLRRKFVTATTCGAILFAAFLGCSKEESSSGTNGKSMAGPGEKHKGAEAGEKDKGEQKPDSNEKPSDKIATTKAEPIALEDFPIPKDAEIVMSEFDTQTIMMRGPNKMDETIKHCETKLGEKGWKKNEQESETIEGVGFLQFEKGGLTIGITLNPGRDGKDMTIMAQGSGVSVPKDDDAE